MCCLLINAVCRARRHRKGVIHRADRSAPWGRGIEAAGPADTGQGAFARPRHMGYLFDQAISVEMSHIRGLIDHFRIAHHFPRSRSGVRFGAGSGRRPFNMNGPQNSATQEIIIRVMKPIISLGHSSVAFSIGIGMFA